MAIVRQGTVARTFVTRALPWLTGAGGLLVYCLTLNPWVSLLSLGPVTKLSGTWQPPISQPLTFLLLYPFRWLPASVTPLALNIFTAICASLVLVLLARSVALLPQDLSPVDVLRKEKPESILSTPRAWMPPVLTAMVCGLQLTFWEHATSASEEILDLLIFAYVVRCLFEFRIDRDECWLSRAALLYGIGMANNWAMVGYAPMFMVAVLRAQGLRRSLKGRWMLRLIAWGLAGLSLYLLLPLLHAFWWHGPIDFIMALKLHLKFQLQNLAVLRFPAIRLLVLASLLPVLLFSIRWKSHTAQPGDDTPLGVFLTKTTGHLIHGLALVISLWLALDPTFSPRRLNLGPPMLTCYYLSALVFGFCAGYFLLLESSGVLRWFSSFPRMAGWILLLGIPAGLVWRNSGQIAITNGPALHNFARQLHADLPTGKSVVLSEDWRRLQLVQAELRAHRQDKESLLLNTILLSFAQYHIAMANEYKSRWPFPPPTNSIAIVRPQGVRRLVSAFSAREPVIYLHPSSGLLTELFQDEPRGLIHHLLPRGGKELDWEPLAKVVVLTNELIWGQRWTNNLDSLAEKARNIVNPAPKWKALLAFLRLTPERNSTAAFLGSAYSKSLNFWGVEMQRLGRWEQAGIWFDRAVELNPENLSARINLLYNEQCRRGDRTQLQFESIENQFRSLFSKYEDWPRVLDANGPVDEPTFLLKTALVLLPGGNFRQATRTLVRCSQLAPDWPAPKLWLARIYLDQGRFDECLQMTGEIVESGRLNNGTGLANLLSCRVMALRGLGRTNEATDLIGNFVAGHEDDEEVLMTAAFLYGQNQQFAQELHLLEALLKRDPNDVRCLSEKGLVQLRLAQYQLAAVTFTKALSLAPAADQARLHRAVAYLGADRLEAARLDYEELLKTTNLLPLALFGLGEIAWREQNTNGAIQFYQQFLSNSNPRLPQYTFATDRLNRLKSRQVP